MGSHALVIGKVVETHVSEDCLTDGQPDMNKVRPFIFVPGKYHAIGEAFADAFSVGNEIKKVKEE
jgi:flavin reductase (DIM6/NTAB) family NADH-FMN oxidoreductase RutF